MAVKFMALCMLVCAIICKPHTAHAQQSDTVRINLIDVDVRAAVQALSQYLDRPVIFGAVSGNRITLQTPQAVRRSEVLGLLKAALESQNLELVSDTNSANAPYRVRAKEQVRPIADVPTQQGGGGGGGGPMQLYVIRLSHARAPDVAATINALYGKAYAFGEIGRSTSTTLSQELQNTQQATYQPGMQPGIATQNGRPAALTGETVIIPDLSSNSLLVRANASDFDLIRAAVREVDIRPLQVLIEVLIAEARKDANLSFGVDVNLPTRSLPQNPGVTVAASQTGLGLGDLVIRVMGAGGVRDLDVILRAAESRGDVSILSRPAVVAVNNERAEILVGSQRPFVQVSRSLPTDAPSRDQVVQYKDVGTKLSVRPTISADGFVMLEVSQEVNAATSETAFDAPVISTRSVQTRLLLKDGQTIVIGGLADKQREVTRAGVPILSSLPIIGGLFGRSVNRDTETELFLFITPRIIRNDEEAQGITDTFKKKADKRDDR